MKQLEVQIMGQSYLLGCPEGGELPLQAAVERVDAAMCRIRDAGKVKARDRIAVLAALNLAFDLVQIEHTATPAGDAPMADAPAAYLPDAATMADEARVAHLLRRLDIALAGDGHLL